MKFYGYITPFMDYSFSIPIYWDRHDFYFHSLDKQLNIVRFEKTERNDSLFVKCEYCNDYTIGEKGLIVFIENEGNPIIGDPLSVVLKVNRIFEIISYKFNLFNEYNKLKLAIDSEIIRHRSNHNFDILLQLDYVMRKGKKWPGYNPNEILTEVESGSSRKYSAAVEIIYKLYGNNFISYILNYKNEAIEKNRHFHDAFLTFVNMQSEKLKPLQKKPSNFREYISEPNDLVEAINDDSKMNHSNQTELNNELNIHTPQSIEENQFSLDPLQLIIASEQKKILLSIYRSLSSDERKLIPFSDLENNFKKIAYTKFTVNNNSPNIKDVALQKVQKIILNSGILD